VIALKGLIPPHFCARLKPGHRFLMPYGHGLFMLNSLRREIVNHFVDIGRIVEHHCLNFLFINYVTVGECYMKSSFQRLGYC